MAAAPAITLPPQARRRPSHPSADLPGSRPAAVALAVFKKRRSDQADLGVDVFVFHRRSVVCVELCRVSLFSFLHACCLCCGVGVLCLVVLLRRVRACVGVVGSAEEVSGRPPHV